MHIFLIEKSISLQEINLSFLKTYSEFQVNNELTTSITLLIKKITIKMFNQFNNVIYRFWRKIFLLFQ